MIIIGLTGSIGMGKSTIAKMFERAGAALFDADGAVHELYAKGGQAVPIIRAVFPHAVKNGAVEREVLSAIVRQDPLHLEVLESFIHPLVRKMRERALAKARAQGSKIMVFDIPLLFETGGQAQIDITVVVSAPGHIQTKRVLARAGMSRGKLDMIRARQMPDAEKRQRADYVIINDKTLDFAEAQVQAIIGELLGRTVDERRS